MSIIEGTVTSVRGFRASGIAAGVKSDGKEDIGLLVSDSRCATAAVFTQNSLAAAPVILSKSNLQSDHTAQAIIVNSGNANCMTGEQGLRDAKIMADDTATELQISPTDVLVCSTGIIGKPLPIDKVGAGIKLAQNSLSENGGEDFAKAILTTDTKIKTGFVQYEFEGSTISIGGVAKGVGMIQPNMATMLCFLTSDINISSEMLQKALSAAVEPSFNSISVDGSTSTNDTVTIFANGLANNPVISEENSAYMAFLNALNELCLNLAIKIVRDGEGATMLLRVTVTGAENTIQAKQIGYAVANSPLVKTAAHGKTGNWGRIAQAVGSLGLPISEQNLEVKTEISESDMSINIKTDLGTSQATIYGCDLSREYVDINVDYN